MGRWHVFWMVYIWKFRCLGDGCGGIWNHSDYKIRTLGSVASKIEVCSVCWEGFWWSEGAFGDLWGPFGDPFLAVSPLEIAILEVQKPNFFAPAAGQILARSLRQEGGGEPSRYPLIPTIFCVEMGNKTVQKHKDEPFQNSAMLRLPPSCQK